MWNTLGVISGFKIYSYAVIHLLALVSFILILIHLSRRFQLRLRHAVAIALIYIFTNFAGARLLYLIKIGTVNMADFVSTESGFWGWLLLFIPAILIYSFFIRSERNSFYKVLSLSLLPTFAFQKFACFAAGCCWGKPTNLPWAVRFPPEANFGAPDALLHPVQLYDTLFPLAGLWIVLRFFVGKPLREPYIFPFTVAFYSMGRFFSEFFRGDLVSQKSFSSLISNSQLIEALTFLAITAGMLAYSKYWLVFLKEHKTEY